MKRVKIWLVLLISTFLMPGLVNAASGTISVTGPSTAIQGNKVTVTVKISSSKAKLGSWQMDLNYDKNYLKLVSASSEGGGTTMVNSSSTGIKSKSYTFTFEARKTGTTKVSVSSYEAYDFDTIEEISLTSSSKSIKIMTQSELEATYSSNAALSSLGVTGYDLSPKFDKSTLEYNVEVENDITSATITGKKADSNASVSGLGSVELNEGSNRFEVIVTAQKGNEQTYVINIYRKEKNPINISYNGDDYSVVRKSDELENLSTFESKEITYGDEEIPALYNEVTDMTLIGLKDSEGKVVMGIYKDDIIGIYNELKSNNVVLYPHELPESKVFDKYIRKNIKYDNMTVEGYVLDKKSTMIIIYAENMETGDLAYYKYDTDNQTIQLYTDELDKYYEELLTKYKYVLFGFIGLSFLLFMILILRKPKKVIKVESAPSNIEVEKVEPKSKKTKKKEVKEETEDFSETELIEQIKEIKVNKKETDKENKKEKKKRQKINKDFDI